MIDQALIAQEYGFLGDMIHLNACSVGVPPMRVQKAAGEFFQAYMPMVYDSNNVGFGGVRSRVRGQIARLIHAEADEIAFTKNTTEGTAALAWGYPLGPGDNVVVADLENHSNLYPWVNASGQKGFKVKLIKTDGRGVKVQDYLDQIDEHTKIVAVSAVQAGCGARIDLARLGRFCRENGIVLSVDAIQGLGRLNLDVQACQVDFLSCGGFKALGAGFGIGFLYCRRELLPRVTPMIAGSGCVDIELSAPEVYPEGMPLHFFEDAKRFEGGSSNATGIWLLHHSLMVQEELGKENIEQHVLSLEALLRGKLNGCGLDILPGSDLPSGVVVAWVPKAHFEAEEAILKREDIHLSHHEGYLRLSISAFNTAEQMDRVAEAFWEIGALGNECQG